MSSSQSDAADLDDVDVTSVPSHVWHYARDQENLSAAARDIKQYLNELATAASIPVYAIESRSKSLASYHDKSEKVTEAGERKYHNPIAEIHDCVAARIIVFTTRARNDLAELIASRTEIRERQNPGLSKFNGYDSEHLIITDIFDRNARSRHAALAKYLDSYSGLEVQIRSVAGHAWAEYEHDTRYKSGAFRELNSADKAQIHQWFIEAGGMRRVMDEVFDRIETFILSRGDVELEAEEPEPPAGVGGDSAEREGDFTEDADTRPLDEATLFELLQGRFPGVDAGDTTALKELLQHMGILGLRSAGQLLTSLSNLKRGQVDKRMNYPPEVSGSRRLDDELLALFGNRYIDSTEDQERKQLLELRLPRVSGAYSFYSIKHDGTLYPPVAAARAVRDLVKIVSRISGSSRVVVENAISLVEDELIPSAAAKPVQVDDAVLYVATNLTRANAEFLMEQLVSKVPGSNLTVLRAGEVLFDANGNPPTPVASNEAV